MQILIMIKQQLKLLLRNRIAILAAISVPLLLTYLFSLSSNSNAREKLYIADADKSAYSEQLIIMLKSHEDIEIVDSTEDIIKTKIDSQEISLGLVINKDFGENLLLEKGLDLNIVQNIENGESTILEQAITSEVSTFKKVILDSKYISSQVNSDSNELSSKIFSNIKSSSNISVDDKTLENGQNIQDPSTVRLIGFLAMFIWFVVIQGFRTLIDEKENNTFNRLLSMPTNYNKYLISKIVATYIFAGLHIIAILIAGKYLLKATIANNLFPVGLIFAAYLLLLTSITLFFALFVKNQRNFTIFSSIIITVTGILGGSFFSLELAPKYMQTISKFTPESWAIQSLKDIVFNNSSINSQVIPLTVFIGVSILGLILSVIFVNRKIKVKNNI